MRVEVEHLPQSQVRLQIEIDPQMLGAAFDKAYHRLAGRYRVPGFRPGKAPRAVLERAIGQETLVAEAADICMNDAYQQALKEHDLEPLGSPDVESPKSEDIDPEQPLSFSAKVYVQPKVVLGDYRSLRIAPQIPEITAEDVEAVLRRYQEQNSPWEPVEGRPAQAGDLASLRIIATVEDETLVDQDAWEYRLGEEEGANLPIPGLAGQVIGMEIGESKDVTIDLGAEYTPAEYAGKQMSLHLELLGLDHRAIPDLDDAFAQSLGGIESLSTLRQSLQSTLQAQTRREALDRYMDDVVRQVVEQASADAPPPLVEQEIDDMMRQLQSDVERERKISMDTYTRVVGKSMEELREEARPNAEQRVRTNLVLDAVADAESITVPPVEIDEQVRQVAAAGTLSNKERRRVLGSESLRGRLERRLRRRHAIDRLLEITRPPDAAPLEEAPETENDEPAIEPAPEPAAIAAAENPSSHHNEQEN